MEKNEPQEIKELQKSNGPSTFPWKTSFNPCSLEMSAFYQHFLSINEQRLQNLLRIKHLPDDLTLLRFHYSVLQIRLLSQVAGQELLAEFLKLQNANLWQPLQLVVWLWISYLQKQGPSVLSETSTEYKGTK